MTQVLVVAPTPAVRGQLQDAARQAGVSVEVKEDFASALAEIEREPPVLVLAEDPDDETLEELRRTLESRAPATPFLIYLPERDGMRALARMSAGAYDCLCPPLSPGDLLAAGKRAVSRVGRRLLTAKSLSRPTGRRAPLVALALGLALFFGLWGLRMMGWGSAPFHIYQLASEHPVGAAGDKDALWVADWSQQNLTELRLQGGYVSIVRVHRLPDFQPVAVALAPYYVYTASADGRLRRHRRDEALTVTASVKAPEPAPAGLAWDGEALWSCDADSGRIYEHDPKLGVRGSFRSPAAKPVGLAWRKGSLWVADGQNNALWKLTRRGAAWEKEGPFALEVFSHNRQLAMSGFTLWKDKAWIVSEAGGVLIRHRRPEKP